MKLSWSTKFTLIVLALTVMSSCIGSAACIDLSACEFNIAARGESSMIESEPVQRVIERFQLEL